MNESKYDKKVGSKRTEGKRGFIAFLDSLYGTYEMKFFLDFLLVKTEKAID